jgi:N6-adenosine-specific RNA methylase IME4
MTDVVVIPALSLVKYEAARNALAAARSVDEVKDIRNVALALEFYAKQAKDRELIDDATDIRLRAELRLGEMIAAQKETVGLATGAAGIGRSASAVPEEYRTQPPTLAEAGIDKKLSARAQKLASLLPEEFAQRLASAKKEAVASIEMPFAARAAEKKQRRAEREVELGAKITALPTRKFGVILADPEWKFETWSQTGLTAASADNHYPCSPLAEIKARDVPSIAADDSVLFLWATVPMLPHALEVMSAWSFTYKSHVAWVKNKAGTGYWFRNRHELLLVGTRGHVPAPAPGTQFDSAFEAPVREHSRKPDVAYEMIEAMFPSLPKIELNARAEREGWSSWGNQAPVTADAADLHLEAEDEA